jgi:hypothetical protein
VAASPNFAASANAICASAVAVTAPADRRLFRAEDRIGNTPTRASEAALLTEMFDTYTKQEPSYATESRKLAALTAPADKRAAFAALVAAAKQQVTSLHRLAQEIDGLRSRSTRARAERAISANADRWQNSEGAFLHAAEAAGLVQCESNE